MGGVNFPFANDVFTRGMQATSTVTSIVAYVLLVIGLWQIFSKANEESWKAIIPIYNIYILFKISWKASMFWVTMVMGIIYAITYKIGTAMMGGLLSLLAVVILLVALAAGIVAFIISVKMYYRLSCSFGYGKGFTVGLVFLSAIFIPILGFTATEYRGPME
ncbi:MAG: hypothetical protein J1E62_08935 [Lachnospiraceae bacterium]|nr:hypothetical protein [Lachnospiraceae bacterium]